jgi:hypothetical protein
MNRRLNGFIGLSAAVLLAASPLSFAQEQGKPMHMHKSQMNHDRQDAEVAAEYKSEAMQLREKAESHRELANVYRGRTPVKGAANYANVAKHCEKLAKFYENAAKEAEAVSAELGR